MLLTAKEITDLTGTRDIDKQKSILREHGIPYIVRLDNKISITWEVVNSALLKDRAETAGPNWSALDG